MEIPPTDKRRLYEALDEKGLTLKEWFLEQLRAYLAEHVQPSLFEERGTDV